MSGELRTVMVIGLGRFGIAIASELTNLGHDVIGVDEDADRIEEYAGEFASVVQSSCASPQALRRIGVLDVDAVVVAMGSDVEASVLITMHLVELGVERIWAKAVNEAHRKILERVGAHNVLLPEVEVGRSAAHRLADRVHDYFTIEESGADGPGFALIEADAPPSLCNLTLSEADLRRNAEVTVVSVKAPNSTWGFAAADTRVEPGSVLLVAGEPAKIDRWVNKR